MSKLREFAEQELRRAGLFDPDSDYDGAIGPEVMKLVDAFCGNGHSGGSAEMTLAAFDRVIRWKPLTGLTDDPNEWMDVADKATEPPDGLWQSRRSPSCFSKDGGKTYYDIDAGDERAIKHSLASSPGAPTKPQDPS